MITGLSDFDKMVVTVLKTTFLKSKPRVITYRDYRSFDHDKCKADLKNFLRVRNVSSYLVFQEIFLHALRRHTPIKQKLKRVNHAPYATKAMRKVIMKTTQLHHNISKIDLENIREISDVYRLYKREKKKYFNNLDLNKITNNKVFWKTVKPFLLDKGINTT